ncbi:MAG: hypothetical protein IPH05_15555 [Flavobacteriales bacterium]|nr:hypothetical protein [Flavobacteriales bacterium]
MRLPLAALVPVPTPVEAMNTSSRNKITKCGLRQAQARYATAQYAAAQRLTHVRTNPQAMTETTDYVQLFENLKKTFEKIYEMKWSDDKALFTQFGLLYFSVDANRGATARANILNEKLDRLASSLGK